jgi:outer membrane protein assembly factor BamB
MQDEVVSPRTVFAVFVGLAVVAVLVVGITVVYVRSGSSTDRSTASSVSDALVVSGRSLDVVGGPIGVGSTAVVVSVDRAHVLHLVGVDPVTNTVLWQHPYSASAITPGVPLTPAFVGNTVVDVAPASDPANPAVLIGAVNASTGALEWQLPEELVLSDNPSSCVKNQDFCITAYNADGSSGLAVLNASTGAPMSTIPGPNRLIGSSLYQSDAQTPTFEQLSPTGTIAWTKSVAAIFGSGSDPSSGWNVMPVGGLNVGSVGPNPSGTTVDFGATKTVAFDTSTGATHWSIPGAYQCMGGLTVLSTQVTCQYSGSVHYSKNAAQPPSLAGVTLKLVGFNPATGAITWSEPVSDVASLSFGNNVRFVNGTQLVVQNMAGKMVSLNTSTGATTALKHGQVLWCEKMPTYKVVAEKGAPAGGLRTGQPVFYPCTANGSPSTQPPPSFPSSVGIRVHGVFVWPSPNGLQTHVVGESHTNV